MTMTTTTTTTTTLQRTLDSLVVPAAFARHDKIADSTVLADLHAWTSNAEPSLGRLGSLDVAALSASELANLVCVLAPFTAVASWSSPATRSLASALLARIPPSKELVTHILTQAVKPLFAPTPHPRLHTSTARILPRPADVQDTYIQQPWKERPGIDKVIRWCLLNTESSAYESVWPLFLPPVMSFLDDYQVPYKLLGASLISDMLTRVPPELLLRTGVDALMFDSLMNSFLHLGDQSTPDFIRLAVPTTLQLIDLTTPSMFPSQSISLHNHDISTTMLTHTLSSSQSKSLAIRFSRLSTLLSSTLLGSVIMYTPTFLPPVSTSASGPDPFIDPQHVDIDVAHVPDDLLQEPAPQHRSFNPTLVAAAQTLPTVLSAIGIGGARFLKGIIPVLAEWLTLPLPIFAVEGVSVPGDHEGTPANDAERSHHTVDISLHLASLSSLSVLLHTCTPRIGGWSTTIIDALGRCWVGCLDLESQRGENIKDCLSHLKKQLKETVIELAKVCPDVIKNEYSMLLTFDQALFEDLVSEIS